jgi:uncharacterized protein YdaU (DUF1376 family)
MKNNLYMPLHPGDYLNDTNHLTAAEHGAYFLLIMNYWQRGEPLPTDDKKLRGISRMTPEEWEGSKETLLEYFVERDGRLYHKRIEDELDRAKMKSAKARDNGRRSAESRRVNPTNAEQSLNERSTSVERPPSDRSTNSERSTNQDQVQDKKDSSLRSESPPAPVAANGGLLELVEPSPEKPRISWIEEEFQRLCAVYPKRGGSQPRKPAFEKFERTVRKGANPDLIIAAAKAYGEEMRQRGKVGTEFVKQIASWLNTEPWVQLAPPTIANAPRKMADDQWRGLVKAYISTGGNWPWRDTSPEPGRTGCRVPREILDEFRDDLKRVMWPEYFAAAFGLEFAGAAE